MIAIGFSFLKNIPMKTTNPKKQNIVKMPLVHPDAAGIDVGDTIHAVAVPEGRDEERVRSFGTMTCDLEEIIKWLRECSIKTVAMESTGVYWKPLFNMLCKEGFEVYLVNSKHAHKECERKEE